MLKLYSQFVPRPTISVRHYATSSKGKKSKKKLGAHPKRGNFEVYATTNPDKMPNEVSDVALSVTDTLLELLSSPDFPKEMYQEVGDRIEAYKGILKNVPAGPLRAVALHEGMEQAFREEIEEMKAIGEEPLKITCCNHCCHRMVRVTVDEAELLVNQLRKIEGGQISDETISKLKRQAEYGPEKELDFWLLPKEESKCVFLSKAGDCSIYESRPVDCRLMRVTSDPELCSKEATKRGERIDKPISMMGEILLSSAIDLTERPPMPLPAALLQHLPFAPKNDYEEEQRMKDDALEYQKRTRFDPNTKKE